MPELPEVDAARASIDESFAGQRVVEVQAFEDDKVMQGCTAAEIEDVLRGRKLVVPRRKGKHLWFEMEGDKPMPLFHLGMTGAFEIRGASVVKYRRSKESDDAWPPKWCKVAMEFEGGGALAFVDSRRFARIRVAQQPLSSPHLSGLGWDALSELPELPDFSALLRRSQRVVKAVLLDQTVLCGIGNWVADEVLFQAQVHPETSAPALLEEELARLHAAITHVLTFAVSVRADSSLFPHDWLFHVRWNKKEGTIKGHKITFITSGGRTSAVVPALQGHPRTISSRPKGTEASSSKPKRKASTRADAVAKTSATSRKRRAPEGVDAPQSAVKTPSVKARQRRRQRGAAEVEGAGEKAGEGAGGGGPGKKGTKARKEQAGAAGSSAKAEAVVEPEGVLVELGGVLALAAGAAVEPAGVAVSSRKAGRMGRGQEVAPPHSRITRSRSRPKA